MVLGRVLASAALLTAALTGCSSSAGGEPDDSATPSSESPTSDGDDGPVRVDGGVAAPGSLSGFECAADDDGWSASGTITNTESEPADFRITIVVASPDASRAKAREITVTDVPSGETSDFKTKKLPTASGDDTVCSVQVAVLHN